MRVAFVAEETAHRREADAAVRTRRLAELLAGRGHEVCVFCMQWWEGVPDAFEDSGVEYRAIAEDPEISSLRFATRLPAAVRRFSPDVIHGLHTNSTITYGTALAAVWSRSPFLLEWYDVGDETGGRSRWNRLAVRFPGRVVVPSEMVQTAVRELGRSADGIAVVPNAIDMDAIRAAETDPIADIVYSRRLDESANLESLLLALAELREMDWSAVIIGDGPARPDYEEQASDLRIDDRVTFVGDQPTDRRLSIFKGARVYVQTALRTPFATDLLRALACGCVGIAEYHAASSAHELVTTRSRGIVTTSEDELTAALRQSADYERREIDESFAEFDEDRIVDRYLDHYRAIGASTD